MNRTRQLLATACTVMPLPTVALGAFYLAGQPTPLMLTVAISATIATILLAFAIHRRITRTILEPIDELNSKLIRGEPVDSDSLPALAHHIRERISIGSAPDTVEHSVMPSLSAEAGNIDDSLVRGIQDTATLLATAAKQGTGTAGPRLAARLELLTDELRSTSYAMDYRENIDFRDVVDRAIDALHACGLGAVVPVFSDSGQFRVNGNPSALAAVVFAYLRCTAPARGYLHVRLPGSASDGQVRRESRNELVLFATAWQGVSPDSRLEELANQTGATLEEGLLTLPGLQVDVTPVPQLQLAHAAADTEGERRALEARLRSLGFAPTSDPTNANVCIARTADPAKVHELIRNARRVITVGPTQHHGALTIEFPVLQSELKHALDASSEPPAEQAPLRVLVVDDDERSLQLLADTCRADGISVAVAVTVAQAEAEMQQTAFDALFVDLNLGTEDGVSIGARLHQQTAAPVFILTANAQSEDRDRASAAGLADTLIKPLQPDLIRSLVEGKRAPTAVPRGTDPQRFDPALALRLSHFRPEVAREMIETLIDSIPGNLANIRAALAEDNRELVRELAHSFSGGLQYCGVPKLRIASQMLENAARGDSLDEIRLAFLVFESEAEMLIEDYGANRDVFETSVIRLAD